MKKAIGIWATMFGVFIAAAVAQTGAEAPEDPAFAAWAKAYQANPLAWNKAWFEAVDASALTAAQKWGLAKQLIALEAKHGARGLREFWEEASAPIKTSMRAATKKVYADAKAALAAQSAVVDQEIVNADATPVPTPTPEATPQP